MGFVRLLYMSTSSDMEILGEFKQESKILIESMNAILEECESDFSQRRKLESYGQTVDRIMGGAKSLAVQTTGHSALLQQLGDYAELCKTVGYKASQITDNESFYAACVGFLLDATEILEAVIDQLGDVEPGADVKGFDQLLEKTFIDRLRWIGEKFGSEYRATVGVNSPERNQKMEQSEIDILLKKLGI